MEGCHLPALKNSGSMNPNLTGQASVSWILEVPLQLESSKKVSHTMTKLTEKSLAADA